MWSCGIGLMRPNEMRLKCIWIWIILVIVDIYIKVGIHGLIISSCHAQTNGDKCHHGDKC